MGWDDGGVERRSSMDGVEEWMDVDGVMQRERDRGGGVGIDGVVARVGSFWSGPSHL